MVGGQVDERYGGSFVTEAAEKFNITWNEEDDGDTEKDDHW